MIEFKLLHPRATYEHLGWIPEFLSEHVARPAREQLASAYAHGGGWQPMQAWTRTGAVEDYAIKYPGDPALKPIAKAELRKEVICVYEGAWVGIFQPNGEFEVSRMD